MRKQTAAAVLPTLVAARRWGVRAGVCGDDGGCSVVFRRLFKFARIYCYICVRVCTYIYIYIYRLKFGNI